MPKCSCSQVFPPRIQQTFHRTAKANSVTGMNLPARQMIYSRESPKNLYFSRRLQETPHLTTGHRIYNDKEHLKQVLDEKVVRKYREPSETFQLGQQQNWHIKIRQADVMQFSAGRGCAVGQGFWVGQKHAGIHCHKDICSPTCCPSLQCK